MPGRHRRQWDRPSFHCRDPGTDTIVSGPVTTRTAVRRTTVSALFGWHPEPIRRLRLGFLVGIGGMSTTDGISNFIPALATTDRGDRTESSMAVSAGLDGAIAFTRRLALVPQVRVHRPFALPFLVGREATYRLQVALR